MYKYSYIVFIVFVALFVQACGFHLAGKGLAGEGEFSDELSNSHIQNIASSKEMLRHLEKSLRANKINVVEAEGASALIRILNEETGKEVTTVDGDGKAREFELFLRITFDVNNSNNKALLTKQVVNVNRNFVFDKNNLLGANEEQRKLYDEMRRDAAKLIVYRLQTI